MEPAGGLDICLVCMPYSPVGLPALGVGLLHAILSKAGLAVKTLYPNMWFADKVGFDRFNIVIATRTEDLAIEWLFSGAAFHAKTVDDDDFIDSLIARNWALQQRDRAAVGQLMHELRAEAEDFVDTVAVRVLAHKPRVVGCTSTFQQHVASLALLRRIRELDPSVVSMMGGANCETQMGRATHRAFPWVDYVVSGEADQLIVPLCRAILTHGRDAHREQLPTGVFAPVHRDIGYPAAREGDGVPRAIVPSLADMPPPDYDDYFEQLDAISFRERVLPTISFETSRGCWWGERSHCTFCGLNGTSMRYRAKDADVVIEDLDHLYRRYRTLNFHAVDNILDMHYFETVLPRLARREPSLNIFYETKANLKRHQVELLRAAGVRFFQPGIESLSTELLKLMGKGCAAWQNVQLLKSARQLAVRLIWTNLMGFPGEEDAWFAAVVEWLPLISHLQPGGLGQLRFDRYSPYHARAESYGVRLRPSELYPKVYPLPETELAELAYFFERDDGCDPARNLLHQPIPDKPGAEALRRGLLDWRACWVKAPPVLQYREIGDAWEIEDTRPVAPERETVVQGLAREVLRASDDAPARAQINHRIAATRDAAPTAVVDATDDLIRRKLVIELDGRIIGLPLLAPLQPIPKLWQIPLGVVLPADWADLRAPAPQ
jgi:ribosomal peptide maturation radical SAM protein 1